MENCKLPFLKYTFVVRCEVREIEGEREGAEFVGYIYIYMRTTYKEVDNLY